MSIQSGTRSRSRSPVRGGSQEPYEIESDPEESECEPPPSADCRKIRIDRYPFSWTIKEIKQFIRDRTNSSIISDSIKHVHYTKHKVDNSTLSTVEFTNANICRQAYNQLKARQNEKCEGKLIVIRWDRSQQNVQPQFGNKKNNYNSAGGGGMQYTRKPTFKPSRPQISLDTYGLSKAFLHNLGIELPILNKIFVANLEHNNVNEAKLREVFGSAGQIVDVFMIKKGDKPNMAKIEYDHPLEAVQAISMFNGHMLYGRQLAVQMDNSPVLHSKPLPAGLKSIGPGLGPNGEVMRGLRYMAELQPLKGLIHTELTKFQTLIAQADQSNMNQGDSSMGIMNQGMHSNSMTPLNINTMNPFNQQSVQQSIPVMNPFAQGNQGLQMLQGLLQQNVGNELTAALAAIQAKTLAPNLVGLGQTFGAGQTDWNSQSSSMQTQQSTQLSDNSAANNSSFDKHSRKSEDGERKMMTTDMLIFNNLPSSVSLRALKSKMREVGDVKFAEITDEGKAIVRFHDAADAERCVKLFNRSKVDGQVIQVRFF